MDQLTPPKPIGDALPLQPVQETASTEPGPAAKTADELMSERLAALRNELLPKNVLVRLDENAHRFVQTISDANTNETLLRYPSEQQLAYARAVMAYFRAQTGGEGQS